jgi:hypothetical protein
VTIPLFQGRILNGAGAQVFGCLNFADLVQSYDMYTLKLENSLVLMIFTNSALWAELV